MPGAAPARVQARRVLIIANPRAGMVPGHTAGESAARAGRRAGLDVTLCRTSGPGDATRLAAAAPADGFDLVVTAGGDGTLHEAANGLAGTGVALGVAPAGTMNLMARSLGLPLDPASALTTIAGGYRPLAMRPGVADGRVFVLMAGAGFDAWVLRALLGSVPGKIGFADYALGAIRGLTSFPFLPMSVRTEHAALAAHTAIVGRAPLYGGFLRPTPNARLEDDRLELCALSGGPARLAALLPRLWSGAHAGRPGVALLSTRDVHLSSDGGEVPYHLDGEPAGTLPVTIGLSERILVLATARRPP